MKAFDSLENMENRSYLKKEPKDENEKVPQNIEIKPWRHKRNG